MPTLPDPQFYTMEVEEDVSDKGKSVVIEKFGKKIMVGQAICSCV